MKGEYAADWRDAPDDPDPADLGYEAVELDMIGTTTDGSHRVLVLPTDEEMLADDAFLIADEGSIRDLPAMI
ncbi:hypothetical protein B4589_016170 (plasmid) [Halolamina sp. CBA1230]|uniref:hypothetical protein n=1 Tax=Haloferacaceae TaxID=1644056 RepID=UPI0009A1DE93|nr:MULTISPECIES: hypothetical protein [Halorubraceae]OTF01687.1 hypothetical protein B9G49_00015 [Halorubrum sp. SD683]QKY21947.1 hypothetical protein B4589_016170 [Halolamina sp. CBA1230]